MPLSRAKGKLNTSRPLLQGAKQTFSSPPCCRCAVLAQGRQHGSALAIVRGRMHILALPAAVGCKSRQFHPARGLRRHAGVRIVQKGIPGNSTARTRRASCLCHHDKVPGRKSDREKTLESVRQPPSGARGCAGTVLKIRSDPLCRFSQRPARNRSLSLSELDFVLACVKKGPVRGQGLVCIR